MYKFIFSLFITLFCLSAAAACVGFSHGVCIGADGGPDDGSTGHYDANGYFHRDGQAPAPKFIQHHWASRYGAIAIDNDTNKYATVTNGGSKQEAIDAAINNCNRGEHTTKCTLVGWYGNQCVAYVWGKNPIKKGYQTSSMQLGKTKAIAERTAMNHCSSRSTDCVLDYSDCSYAVQLD